MILEMIQTLDAGRRHRPLIPTLVVVAVAVLLPLLNRRYVRSASWKVRVLVATLLMFVGIAAVIAYVVRFRELSFAAPTTSDGVLQSIMLALPLVLVVACAIELARVLLRRSRGGVRSRRGPRHCDSIEA